MEKKGIARPIVFFLFLVFNWTLVEVFCLQIPSFANEASQIHDPKAVYEKEKELAISGQLDRIGALLEKERFSAQGTEAENFVQEVVNQPPRVVELKVAPTTESKPQPLETKAQAIPLKPSAKGGSASGGKKKWGIFSYGQEKQISEGEALYKVAISDGKVTLHEATKIALANNVGALAAKKKIEVARSKLTEARRALFPTVQMVVRTNRGEVGGQVQDTDADGGLVSGNRFYRGKSQKLNITQPLYHGGELVFTVKQAEENLKFAEEEYKKTRNEAIQQVRTAYYGAVKQEYNLQYQLALLKNVTEFHDKIRQARLARLISEIDFLNVDSQYNQVYFQLESAKNDLLAANLLLRQNLNLESDEFLPINLKINYVKLEPDFDELVKIALATNPELRMKEHALESALYGVKIYEAKKRPKIDLKGSYGMLGEAFKDTRALSEDVQNHTGNHNIDTEKEWFVGIEGSMPLGPNSVEYSHVKHVYGPTVLALTGSEDSENKFTFNLMDKFSEITDEKSAAASYLQAQSELQTAKNKLVSDLREGYYDLKKSVVQMDSAVSKIRYQEKQSVAARYLSGLQETPPASYLESMIELASHKFSLIQAAVDYQLAISTLNLSTGDPYYFETES